MSLRWPQFAAGVWVRTCQECGHPQILKNPATYAAGPERWREIKCRKCRSIALDYGDENSEVLDG